MPERVVISLIGSVLDAGEGPYRWERWRPSVALCQHEDLLVHRFELLYPPKFNALTHIIQGDLKQVSPETQVVGQVIEFGDPWDLEEVYGGLLDFARRYEFRPDKED